MRSSVGFNGLYIVVDTAYRPLTGLILATFALVYLRQFSKCLRLLNFIRLPLKK